MSERRRGLGRGLGALIPSAPSPEPAGDPAAPATPVAAELADAPPPADPAAGEQAALERATPEPADTDPADTEPADTEPADTEPADTEPADTEPADTEPADTEPADTEPADTEPADTEPARAASPATGKAGEVDPVSGVGASPEGFTGNGAEAAWAPAELTAARAGMQTGARQASAHGPRSSAPFGVDVLIPERSDASRDDRARADISEADTTRAATVPDARGGSTAGSDDSRFVPVPGAHFAELPLEAITPNLRQPRQVFDEDDMAELVHSLREVGLLQPVVVRETTPGRFELVMGERRWRAAQQAGFERIPAIVRVTEDTDMLRDALLENLHRSQLNPLEEAAAYDQLLKDFGCTHEELATRIGRSRPQVSNTLRLLRLPAVVQRRVAAGVLSAGHARALLGLEDGAAQERLAQRIVAEGLSVRAVEEIVAVGGAASDNAAAPARRTNRPVAPRLQDLASSLSDRFETRVKVDLGRRKGRIVVEFGSLDDLERIIGLMDGTANASGPVSRVGGPSGD